MKKMAAFLIVLLGVPHSSVAAPLVRSENKTMIDVQGEMSESLTAPSMTPSKGPGILLCPEPSAMSKDKEISFLDKHSSDCAPTDNLNGEIKANEPIEVQ